MKKVEQLEVPQLGLSTQFWVDRKGKRGPLNGRISFIKSNNERGFFRFCISTLIDKKFHDKILQVKFGKAVTIVNKSNGVFVNTYSKKSVEICEIVDDKNRSKFDKIPTKVESVVKKMDVDLIFMHDYDSFSKNEKTKLLLFFEELVPKYGCAVFVNTKTPQKVNYKPSNTMQPL